MFFLNIFFQKINFKSDLICCASTYGFFSLINSAIPFLLMPIMTRYLSLEDYGITVLFNLMVSILTILIGLNLSGAYNRIFFAQDRFDSNTYLGTIMITTILFGIFYTIFFFVFSQTLSTFIVFPNNWLWVAPFVATTSCIISLVLLTWQTREQPIQYGKFLNLYTLFEAVYSIVLVVFFAAGWKGRIFSKTFTSLLFALIGLCIISKRKFVSFNLRRDYLKHALCFSVPLVPHSLSGFLNAALGRIFISHMIGIAETGLYSVGYQVGSIILLFSTAFNQAYVPWLFRNLNINSYKKNLLIVRYTYVYFILILLSAIVLGFLAPLVLKIVVGKDFYGASIFVIWIALGYAFRGMYLMIVNYIFYAEKTHFLAYTTILCALLNVVFNYTFIRCFGPIGAAYAMTLTYFIQFILVWILSARVFNMPWMHVLKICNKD